MKRGLHIKLILIMLLLIISLMVVICAFLVYGVMNFFLSNFYDQMSSVFSSTEMYTELVRDASESDGAERINKMLAAYSGRLGIDASNRNYYILDGRTGMPLISSVINSDNSNALEITPNIITALNGSEGSRGSVGAPYMDLALPVKGENKSYIIYIRDNKRTVRALNMELFTIIIESLVIGLSITFILSFLLSKTVIIPIQSLTRAANKVAAGDFSEKIAVYAKDEIGVLTRTFNDMAQKLSSTLDDIQNERNKLSTVFLHMTDGIAAFSRDGELIHHNPSAERMLGTSFTGQNPDFHHIFGVIIQAEKALELKSHELIEASAELDGRALEISFAPFSGEGEQGGGVMAVIHDVTQQKRLESMRREFVANVSHELRTPITSIRSYAETMYLDQLDADTMHSFLEVIVNESDRMTKIVQDLLILSKFDAGETGMQIAPFDLVDSIRKIYNAMILETNKQGLDMTLEFASETLETEGDKARIEQVLINIVSNAVRYTPEGGSITVSAGRCGTESHVTVRDTGIGIPKEDIPRLFDRFYRVDKARSRVLGGTGLGLSIASEIVSKHGGTIEVESEPGQGTAVTVKLPIRVKRDSGYDEAS